VGSLARAGGALRTDANGFACFRPAKVHYVPLGWNDWEVTRVLPIFDYPSRANTLLYNHAIIWTWEGRWPKNRIDPDDYDGDYVEDEENNEDEEGDEDNEDDEDGKDKGDEGDEGDGGDGGDGGDEDDEADEADEGDEADEDDEDD
jgi:hypothetical protein